MSKDDEGSQDPLRETFVEMLFALAAAQIAVVAAALVEADGTIGRKLPAISHLALALILISTSWVGWRKSRSPGMKEKVQSVFVRAYVSLLLDVILVIIYYIVVQSVGLDQGDPPRLSEAPSALPGARWILVIFVIYVIWDLITDICSHGAIPKTNRFWDWTTARAAALSVFVSFTSLIMISVVVMFARNPDAPVRVVCLNLTLISVLLFFRGAKRIEIPLARILGVQDYLAFEDPRKKWREKHEAASIETWERTRERDIIGSGISLCFYIAMMEFVLCLGNPPH
jgi:hypothetical protein